LNLLGVALQVLGMVVLVDVAITVVRQVLVVISEQALSMRRLLLYRHHYLPLSLGRTPGKRNFSKCSEATT
jgi:hypothetical protein